MTTPSYDSDSNSSSSSDDSPILSTQMLNELRRDDDVYAEMTIDVVDTCAVHVPLILSPMLICSKGSHGGSMSGRRYINRDRKERHDLIVNDYFNGENSKYTPEKFRRRFRMDIKLFQRILRAIEAYDDYFTQKVDAIGNPGLSPLQKIISSIRMLAYGCAADILDEYVQIGESTAIESLKRFCDAVIGIFEKQYLRKPDKDDVAKLLKEGEDRVFPVNGHHYNMGYYLSDGIYPEYATLIQTISNPSSLKEKLFARHQESVRKDVERAFGVLQSRWHIIKGPARMWNPKDLGKIMKTCIILHNMIVESENSQGIDPQSWQSEGKDTSDNVVPDHDFTFLFSRMNTRMKEIQNKRLHRELKIDLINHLWELHGGQQVD
ncbi:unnamed protein product [Cuscuta europaea]|uniref:Nuclease HARBI1 n=1 Tax=Cuscuta europaea TaxID=41803 RepID=A0A9P0ZY84_CUSEU|nr:unnamed protein product [Cuscuta europaea]CAH9119530.1 unnamed protein product [Cuscuta europaea]CAH9119532.1 unnamed protein product [Cuscuta europaea]CAH9119534.1 unnamed protein product [Cuscuta europaea]CAH9119536.1 unnamed protein product [Cuscuta europaea]